MTQADARNFLVALIAMQQYVPPIVFGQVAGSPVMREIETIANQQQAPEPSVNNS